MTDRKHSHYFKSCPYTHVDVYRVLQLFNVTDPCLQHAIKKLLVAGGRGAGKDIGQDVQEAIDTLIRWGEMRNEELKPENTVNDLKINPFVQPNEWAPPPNVVYGPKLTSP